MQTSAVRNWARTPRLADNAGRRARVAELDAAIEAWTTSQPVEQVLERLGAARVPAGKVYTAMTLPRTRITGRAT
jgi:formyl-CoA transferase